MAKAKAKLKAAAGPAVLDEPPVLESAAARATTPFLAPAAPVPRVVPSLARAPEGLTRFRCRAEPQGPVRYVLAATAAEAEAHYREQTKPPGEVVVTELDD